jgi:hypothetical protein
MRSSYRGENIAHSATGFDLDQAIAFAPTLGAMDAHHSRSDRYAMVPTKPILQGLFREGFQLHSISKATVRRPDRKGFEKHMLRLRHRDATALKTVGGTINEIIVVNSHDGSTCFDMRAGMFRFVCSNGMIVGDDIARVKIKHHGDIIGDVIEGAYRVVKDFEKVTESRERMMSIMLHKDEKEALATAAIPLRFDVDDVADAGIEARQLLIPRRYEDNRNDLWTTFNVIQENCIKGGQSGRIRGTNGRMRRMSTREVTGIDQNVKVNQGLHILASRMADLKEGQNVALAA